MTPDEILKKYELTEQPEERPAEGPCASCDAKQECSDTSDAGCNPYYRVCHPGWNLKLKEKK